MAVAETPSDWTDAGLGSAVFSDPRPVLAVLAAIREREAIVRPSSEYDVERGRYARTEANYTDSRNVREVPGHTLARLVARRIRDLCGSFVDMDYDYAARDWSEFPVMLSERFARGEHPMAWCPGLDDPETDEAVGAWRAFLADCRWWLDRMHVIPLPADGWRFGRRVIFGSANDPLYVKNVLTRPGDPPETDEEGEHIADVRSLPENTTDGTFNHAADAAYLVGAYAAARVEQYAECYWLAAVNAGHYYLRKTQRVEKVYGVAYSRLRVRNVYPVSASVVVYACGAARRSGNLLEKGIAVRSEELFEFSYAESSPVPHNPTMASASSVRRKAYLPSSLAGGSGCVYDETTADFSSGTRTLRGWSHDFSEFEDPPRTSPVSALSPSDPEFDDYPPEVRAEREWYAVFRPGLLGLSAGPNVLATLAPGERTAELLEWSQAGLDAVRAETWWLPAALHEYEDKNEKSNAIVFFGVAVVPCLDFEASFRFRADAEQEESPT